MLLHPFRLLSHLHSQRLKSCPRNISLVINKIINFRFLQSSYFLKVGFLSPDFLYRWFIINGQGKSGVIKQQETKNVAKNQTYSYD